METITGPAYLQLLAFLLLAYEELQPVHNPEHDHMVSALVEREKKNVAKIIKRQEFEVQQVGPAHAWFITVHPLTHFLHVRVDA